MELFEKYRYPIIGGGLAFFLALLLVTFGLLKTILIFVLVAAGMYAGFYLKATGIIDGFFDNFK
ncbi:DUF2273 domain-containing protein [Streptococcus pluranimalium]|uniref:DUF2273 domain-containing protein n=1 Tax=Streptococcus pluranimalium TaxID=82348 RepID=UPI0039FCAE59